MLGFQVSTALLSMCIVNTAACALMLPILTAVTSELYPQEQEQQPQQPQQEQISPSKKFKTIKLSNYKSSYLIIASIFILSQ